jgi:hypothetical protein
MTTSQAKKLINIEFSSLMGFDASINSDWQWLAVGVKTGQITPLDAAKKVSKGIKF